MHLKDLLTLLDVRKLNVYLAVKTTCPQQCLVKYVGPVGGCQDNHTAVCSEAIHLSEELVESILPFVIGTEVRVAAAGTPHSVYLIYEHYARRLLLGLLEQIPDT